MDTLILLGSFFVLMMIGVPIAYSLGLAALAGALWIDLPFDAVMIQVASGVTWAIASSVPSPPSARGIVTISSAGYARRQPREIASATTAADADPLNESGATTTTATPEGYWPLGSRVWWDALRVRY